MEKKLPFCYNSIIKFECWTYFRTSIIAAYSELDHWLGHHMNDIYITSKYACDFGEHGAKYNTISHYSQALLFKENTFDDLREDTIIDVLCKNVDDGFYTIIDIEGSKAYDYVEKPGVFQFLIYGYDSERKVFFAPSIFGGSWHESEVEWDHFIEAFKVRKSYSREKAIASAARQNPFPYILIKPRLDVEQPLYLSLFFNEIRSTLAFSDVVCTYENSKMSYRQGILGVYKGLSDLISAVIQDKTLSEHLEYDHGLLSGFAKIREYNALFYKRIKLFDENFALNLPEDIYTQMFNIIKSTGITMSYVIKYQANEKEELLQKIVEQLENERNDHKKLLQSLLDILIKKVC